MPPLEREPQGHEPETRTPGPAPRRARHCGIRPGPVQGAGRRPPAQAVVERDARSGRARRRWPPTARRRERSSSIPTARSGQLREAIAAAYGLNPDRIVCGAGSDDILFLMAHGFIGHGEEGIYTEHGFAIYPIAIRAAGGIPVVAPEKDLTTDVDAILARVTAKTRVVFIANPNNPTGTYIPFDEVRRLHAGLPSDVDPRARRGLCRIRPAERLRERHRAGRHRRQRGDDADLLEDPRPRRAPHRLVLRAGADRRCAQPHPRAVQPVLAGDRRRRRRARRSRPHRARRRPQRGVAAEGRRGGYGRSGSR